VKASEMNWNTHISHTRKEITKSFLELYKDEWEMCEPICLECGEKLKIGDYIDGHFPYENEFNLCKKCEV
jgi:hypothetical protein